MKLQHCKFRGLQLNTLLCLSAWPLEVEMNTFAQNILKLRMAEGFLPKGGFGLTWPRSSRLMTHPPRGVAGGFPCQVSLALLFFFSSLIGSNDNSAHVRFCFHFLHWNTRRSCLPGAVDWGLSTWFGWCKEQLNSTSLCDFLTDSRWIRGRMFWSLTCCVLHCFSKLQHWVLCLLQRVQLAQNTSFPNASLANTGKNFTSKNNVVRCAFLT